MVEIALLLEINSTCGLLKVNSLWVLMQIWKLDSWQTECGKMASGFGIDTRVVSSKSDPISVDVQEAMSAVEKSSCNLILKYVLLDNTVFCCCQIFLCYAICHAAYGQLIISVYQHSHSSFPREGRGLWVSSELLGTQ